MEMANYFNGKPLGNIRIIDWEVLKNAKKQWETIFVLLPRTLH